MSVKNQILILHDQKIEEEEILTDESTSSQL